MSARCTTALLHVYIAQFLELKTSYNWVHHAISKHVLLFEVYARILLVLWKDKIYML